MAPEISVSELHYEKEAPNMYMLYLSMWNSRRVALFHLRFGRNLVASEKNPNVNQVQNYLICRSVVA